MKFTKEDYRLLLKTGLMAGMLQAVFLMVIQNILTSIIVGIVLSLLINGVQYYEQNTKDGREP